MSWSIQYIGKPENIKAAIEAIAPPQMNAESFAEFSEAKPHILALVALNNSDNAALSVWASGSAYTYKPTETGKEPRKVASCTVKIESISGLV